MTANFKTFSLTSIFAILVAAMGPVGANAAVVAVDDFAYPNGDLGGQNGGSGFGGGWLAGSSVENVVGNSLTFTGNNNDAAIRSLATPFTGSTLYFGFTFKFTGALNNDDFFAFWLDNGTSSGFHATNTPNLSLKANMGPFGTDYVVRYNIGGGAYSPVQAVAGSTVQLIGKLEKVGTQYRKLSLWVTTPGVVPVTAPQAIVTNSAASDYTQITRIGMRTANLEGTGTPDSVTVDDLRLATTLEEVVLTQTVLVPEPATIAIWSMTGLAGVLMARRRRSA